MGSRVASRLGAVLLILVLGAVAVAIAVFLAMGAVTMIQRGTGVHLDDPPTPTMEWDEESDEPLGPRATLPEDELGS